MPFLHQWPLLLLSGIVSLLLRTSNADVLVGTAARYQPPYLPTQCFGNDVSELPSNNFFGAAGGVIWDKGASCGRQYAIKCITARAPGACVIDRTIRVKIIDFSGNNRTTSQAAAAVGSGTTVFLSEAAFAAIANSSTSVVNIEFQPL